MNVLAIVSKAVFEKEVKPDQRVVGAVWPTAAYLSANAGLQPLSSGGSLYLFTVRPGEKLWLVAVLEQPKFDGKAWRARPNTVPIVDATALVSKLKFVSGKGITAEPGKLAMSLQTPRTLADDDVAQIGALARRGTTATPQSAYAAGVTETPKAREAAALGARLADEAAAKGLRPLRFDHYRRRRTWNELSAGEKKQLEEFRFLLEEAEEFDGPEIMDVVDTSSGEVAYLFVLWPFGSGVLLETGSTTPVADVVQHGFKAREPNRVLRESLAVAYHHGHTALGIREHVDFSPDEAESKPTTAAPAGSLAEQVAQMRRDVAGGKQPVSKEYWDLVKKVFKDFRTYRPAPVRRVFELDPVERDALELLVDLGAESRMTPRIGLPEGAPMKGSVWDGDPGDLARYLGRAPLGPIDVPVTIDGREHPAWCLVSDVVYGIRAPETVVDLLANALSPVQLSDLWRAVVTAGPGPGNHQLKGGLPRTAEEDSKGVKPADARARTKAAIDFLVSLNLRLGDTGLALARGIADAIDDARTGRAPAPTKRPGPYIPDWFSVATALTAIARRARAAGETLDTKYDALLDALVLSQRELWLFPVVVALLELLPMERAQHAARGGMAFVEVFPSAEGADATIRSIEQFEFLAGPYYDKLFRRVIVDKVGAEARPLLVSSLAREHSRHALIKECLDLLDRGGKKKPKGKS
jgi:hypothetical protein